jgi:signal transduction histidine kinase/ligand-binding sensor domain-containing protein/DNA-binding response OmpR family regulator
MRIISFLIGFLVISGVGLSQHSGYNPVFELESLAGMQVNDIKQDSLGFLWVGTNEGLYRYDGYDMKLYHPTPSNAGSSLIHTIFIDSQNNLWAGTYGGLLKYDKNSDSFLNIQHDAETPYSIGGNRINCIAEDANGNLWIGLSKGGIDQYNKAEKKFYHYRASDKTGLLSDDINDLLVDADNILWISTWNHGLNKLDLNLKGNNMPTSAQFKGYRPAVNTQKIVTQLFMFEDPKTPKIFVGTADHGFLVFDKNNETFERFRIDGLRTSLYDALPDSGRRMLVGTLSGVRLVNLENGTVEPCTQSFCDVKNTVNVIYKDDQDVTWIGSVNGLHKFVEKKVQHVKLDPSKVSTPLNNVIAMRKQGKFIWLGTWGEGLILRDEQSGEFVQVNTDNELIKYIWDLKLLDEKTLLVAGNRGLVKIDVRGLASLKKDFPENNFPSENHFTTFTKNTKGDTWIGTWKAGLYRISSTTGEVLSYDKVDTKGHYIQSIHYNNNELWIGTVHSGLIRISDPNGKARVKTYSQETSDLSSDFVSVIFEDNNHKLWIGTGGGGINILDLETEKIKWILKGDQNLSSNTIQAITQDNNNDMWVSFKSGIAKLDDTGVFVSYSEDDGFENLLFNPNGVGKSGDTLYFGSAAGYNVFKPADLAFQQLPTKIFITDFKIFDEPISPGELYERTEILSAPINELNQIKLSYKVKNIAFKFSSLNFANPKREIFAYTLEGLNDKWIYTNAANRYVSYSNLAPGDYTLKIKAARRNGSDEGHVRTLHISIVPPIWQTPWFLAIAIVFLTALLYFLHWLRLKDLTRQKLLFESLAAERVKVIELKNQQLEQQNVEIQNQARKIHEADQSKINFFANISHEFRTPLMLIIGPIARLMESKQSYDNESLSMIHRNAKRLLRLINQIMDFSKIEAGSLTLETRRGDFVKFVKEITDSLNYLAKIKSVRVEFYASEEECFFNFDHDKIEKIVYNLLSNAFKVTPSNGRVAVTLEILHGDQDNSLDAVRLEIFNSGRGISPEDLHNLFTRFYRTRSYSDGTGIGLSLTKSLVELHGGHIEVRSEENDGTWFYVTIPITDTAGVGYETENDFQDQYTETRAKLYEEELKGLRADEAIIGGAITRKHLKTILILDDDEDMRLFISRLLTPAYNVIESSNGEEALKLAHQRQPDLIVSDMMMPVMDGYQFLRSLKQDSNISHIPIILLTARASMDARLKGLEEGADDYITKPFHEKILLLRVKNLIDRMQKAKERFWTDINLEPKEITITSLDEKFMGNLVTIVEKNIANTNFNSDTICQEMGVGRSYLYAKVKALTDLPVNEFVKTIRLKRAAILLTKGQLHVNEVAYSVGFNDRYYFSKCFLKHFGVSPSQYQNENSKINPSLHE